MTAPRNHPAEDAHPAPTPAPVAVPEGGWREGDQIVADHDGALLAWVRHGERWSPAPSSNIDVPDDALARWVQDDRVAYVLAPRDRARPGPVVAPLPSEAGALVLATIGQRTIPLELQATGVWLSPGRHGSYIAADIDSWVRLVPEDDEDTVRERIAQAIQNADRKRLDRIIDRAPVEDTRHLVDIVLTQAAHIARGTAR